jgi:hypothetical protein
MLKSYYAMYLKSPAATFEPGVTGLFRKNSDNHLKTYYFSGNMVIPSRI